MVFGRFVATAMSASRLCSTSASSTANVFRGARTGSVSHGSNVGMRYSARTGAGPRTAAAARTAGSTLPPVTTATVRPDGSSAARNSRAAVATAPLGSTTSRASLTSRPVAAPDLLLGHRDDAVEPVPQVGEGQLGRGWCAARPRMVR